MTNKLAIAGAAIVLCVAAAGVVILSGGPPQLDSKARKQWKERAIAQIAEQTTPPFSKGAISMPRKIPACSAFFPSGLKDEIVDLNKDDVIRFRGTIKFSTSGLPYVTMCQLLERRKP